MAISVLSAPPSDFAANSIRQTPVVICGGGISGLSLAMWLRQAEIASVVLEKNAAPGGVIGSFVKDGFVFERGPSTVLDKYPSFDELVALAGLGNSIIRVPLATQARYVWLRGQLHRVPQTPLEFLRSPLLPLSAKLALLREPFIGRGPVEESVADFVRRRLGPDWLRNLIAPMVSGIWAGDPEQLSVAHAFPVLKELERAGGLVRGLLKRQLGAGIHKKNKDGRFARPRKNMVSFDGGLQGLPVALAARLGETYRPNTQIESIAPLNDGGFIVRARSSGEPNDPAIVWEAKHVVIAADAGQVAKWVKGFDATLGKALHSVPYNRLAVLSLGLSKIDTSLPPGFGFLVPRGEGLRMLGAIIHSNFLPNRAPAGCTALSVFMGGALDPEILELSDDALIDQARKDLAKAIGWRGEPVAVHIERYHQAIPQYDLQHAGRLAEFAAAEARWPDLHLAGNWRGGVAIAERVEAMRLLAEKLARTIDLKAETKSVALQNKSVLSAT